MHVFPGSPQVCCSRPTSSPVLYPGGSDRGGSAGSGRGRDQLLAGPGARPTGRASTTAAGCQAGPLPFPGFLGFGKGMSGWQAGMQAEKRCSSQLCCQGNKSTVGRKEPWLKEINQ